MSFATSGVLLLETGEVLGPGTSTGLLDRLAIRAEGTVHVRPDGSVFSVRTRLEGRPVHLAATFTGHLLSLIELILLDGSGSNGLAEQELLKAEHERWLESLGVALDPMPLVVDGVPIVPADTGPAYPRYAAREWGELISLIDSKNGGASILLRYTP
jgi:hypothetical protein